MDITVPPQVGFIYDGMLPTAGVAGLLAGIIALVVFRRRSRSRVDGLPFSVLVFRAVGAGAAPIALIVLGAFTYFQNEADDIRVEKVAASIESETVEIVSVKDIDLEPGSDSQLYLIVSGYSSPLDCQLVVSRKLKAVFGCTDPNSSTETKASLQTLMNSEKQ